MRENKTLHYYMKWALMLTFMWVCQFANAQDFVKGKVIDQAGEPVTGAYVNQDRCQHRCGWQLLHPCPSG